MNRIVQLRKQLGYTQKELAESMGVALSTVGMWESGKRTPSFKTLNDLSDLFNKSIEYILGSSDDASSVRPANSNIDHLSRRVPCKDCRKLIKDYMSLDNFGKAAVENLVQMEKLRCSSQRTIGIPDK